MTDGILDFKTWIDIIVLIFEAQKHLCGVSTRRICDVRITQLERNALRL